MITQYARPALLVIAGAVAVTSAQSMWTTDRNRALLLGIVGAICVLLAVVRIKAMKR